MDAKQVYEVYCEIQSQIKSLRSGITKLENAFHAAELLNHTFHCAACRGSKQRREKRKFVRCDCVGVCREDQSVDQMNWNIAAHESSRKASIVTSNMIYNKDLLERARGDLLHKTDYVKPGKIIYLVKKDMLGETLLCKWHGTTRNGNKCLLARKEDKFDSENKEDNIWLRHCDFVCDTSDERIDLVLCRIREKFTFPL